MTKAPEIRGLRWTRTDLPGEHRCVFEAGADATTVDRLLQTIPMGGGLEFYDYLYHGQPPEPTRHDAGAIFSVYRDGNGDLVARCGNHGWGSEWSRVERAELAAFLLGCIDSNRGEGPRSEVMRLTHRDTRPDRVSTTAEPPLLERRDLYAKWRRKGSGG